MPKHQVLLLIIVVSKCSCWLLTWLDFQYRFLQNAFPSSDPLNLIRWVKPIGLIFYEHNCTAYQCSIKPSAHPPRKIQPVACDSLKYTYVGHNVTYTERRMWGRVNQCARPIEKQTWRRKRAARSIKTIAIAFLPVSFRKSMCSKHSELSQG
jgi:hypothetical protein